MTEFFRFPHTPRLAWLGGGEPRDDKVLSAAQAADMLSGEIVVEEKLDGANLGFSLGSGGKLRAQSRGQYMSEPNAGQFVRLPAWLALHGDAVVAALLDDANDGLMIFGEWCAARHSLAYMRLPDWFLLFDVVQTRSGMFWSSERRNTFASRLGLATVPQVARGRYGLGQLTALLATQSSRFGDGPPEGIVVRREDADWCSQRAKLVRAAFTQSISKHWRGRRIEWNRLAAPADAETNDACKRMAVSSQDSP